MMMGSSIALLMVVSGQRFALSINRGNVETHTMVFQITLTTGKQTCSIKELRNIDEETHRAIRSRRDNPGLFVTITPCTYLRWVELRVHHSQIILDDMSSQYLQRDDQRIVHEIAT